MSKLSEDQKMEHFFPQIQVETCAQLHIRVKLLEGMQMKTIFKLLGVYPPRVSEPLLVGLHSG